MFMISHYTMCPHTNMSNHTDIHVSVINVCPRTVIHLSTYHFMSSYYYNTGIVIPVYTLPHFRNTYLALLSGH